MNLLIGDPKDWIPMRSESEIGLDMHTRPIFIRPAVRTTQKLTSGFDDVREWIAEAPSVLGGAVKTAYFRLWSARRILLDIRGVRVAYRALRAVSRGVNRILFSTDRDYDVLVGAIGLAALSIACSLIVLTVWHGW